MAHAGTCHHWQVAQTVSHVMQGHMSSSGVMRMVNEQHGDVIVKYERKKRKHICSPHVVL